MKFKAECYPRYWEDANVNDIEDTDGNLIPFRSGEMWTLIYDVETGKIEDWPIDTTADIYYKVCDEGNYFLYDDMVKYKRKGYYVPNDYLCFGDNGFGDYIILTIDENGYIGKYEKPEFNKDDWNETN